MHFYKPAHPDLHQFYCGIDLHARTLYLCILAAALECGALPPLMFLCFVFEDRQTKKNKSGGRSPTCRCSLAGRRPAPPTPRNLDPLSQPGDASDAQHPLFGAGLLTPPIS